MNSRTVVTTLFAIIFLIAPMLFSGISSPIITQEANASQMNTDNTNIIGMPGLNETEMSGMNATGIPGLNETGITVGDNSQNATSSVYIIPTLVKAILSQVNVSLVDAAMSAQKQVGNNSQVVAVILDAPNGYLVYEVYTISDPDANLERVLVHPGTGQVLAQTTELGGPMNLIPGGMGMGMMPSGPLIGSDIGMMGGPSP